MIDKTQLIPRFNPDNYKNAIVLPLLVWTIIVLLYFIFGFINPPFISAASGFSIFINLLFGAWVAKNMLHLGENMGDSTIAAMLVGLAVGILIAIFFGAIQTGRYNYDFGNQIVPMIIITMLQHGIGAITTAGILGDPAIKTTSSTSEIK